MSEPTRSQEAAKVAPSAEVGEVVGAGELPGMGRHQPPRIDSAATTRFTEEEVDLIRQAVKNQGDEERNAVAAQECKACRERARSVFERRTTLRASALKKIEALR